MKKIIISIIVIIIGIDCFSQLTVYPVMNDEKQIKENTIFYFLPRKVMSVVTEVETEYVIPGPYHSYAEKYLSIKDVPTERSAKSEIVNVEFFEYTEPDPDACFFVVGKKENLNISFSNIGVISGYNSNFETEDMFYDVTHKNDLKYLKNDVYFTDYSVKRNFTGIMDTTYKVIQIDSVFQKIPVYNEVMTSKDHEQKAEEAANYIIKIRKRRFKLQSAQFETEYPPENVDVLIKELDELEQQYLELFIGKKIPVKNTYTFNYIPVNEKKNDEVVMFYLSDELGILESKHEGADPVYLRVENVEITTEIKNFYNKQDKLNDKEKGFYYRIPGHANLSVIYKDLIYSQKHGIIPQHGILNYLPSSMFKNKNLQIIFDENLGSIKSIKN